MLSKIKFSQAKLKGVEYYLQDITTIEATSARTNLLYREDIEAHFCGTRNGVPTPSNAKPHPASSMQ